VNLIFIYNITLFCCNKKLQCFNYRTEPTITYRHRHVNTFSYFTESR